MQTFTHISKHNSSGMILGGFVRSLNVSRAVLSVLWLCGLSTTSTLSASSVRPSIVILVCYGGASFCWLAAFHMCVVVRTDRGWCLVWASKWVSEWVSVWHTVSVQRLQRTNNRAAGLYLATVRKQSFLNGYPPIVVDGTPRRRCVWHILCSVFVCV